MTRPALLLTVAALALSACDNARPIAPPANFPTTALNDAIGARLGGPETCVVIQDAAKGTILYQYGAQSVCMAPLPPCALANIPVALIGVNTARVTPATVYKWDGSPQPTSAWQKDADLKTAFAESIGWWFQRLAAEIGPEKLASGFKAMDYGSGKAGAGLTVSTRQQAAFMQRLVSGRLPLATNASTTVVSLLDSEIQGDGVVRGRAAACDSAADGSRSVGWWTGRLTSPSRDLVIAASIDSAAALPGREVETRVKAALTKSGLWPLTPPQTKTKAS